MTTLPVNEVFLSVQGEGTHTGRLAIFVRLQGCPVGCPWCDTRHTWAIDPKGRVSLDEILAKGAAPADTWAALSLADLDGAVVGMTPAGAGPENAPLVVFTGGEPAIHDLSPVLYRLLALGYPVQVETSGTHYLGEDFPRDAWVTCSPKAGMPGGLSVERSVLARANEIKLVIVSRKDVEDALAMMWAYGDKKPIYLQPVSQSGKALAICLELVKKYGFRLSLQTHKYAGVR
jgi:7-carboxy-7-deazaguanine synthase